MNYYIDTKRLIINKQFMTIVNKESPSTKIDIIMKNIFIIVFFIWQDLSK